MTMQFRRIANGPIDLNVAIAGDGPLILFIHGFPGLWYSWRHSIAYYSSIGYRVAAIDVRGYGNSSKPDMINAYKLRDHVADAVAVIDALSEDPVFVVGDDWGAVIAWYLALLAPDRVRAVAGLSVPYVPPGSVSFIDIARHAYGEQFFYQLFFQKIGIAEQRLEIDVDETLRNILFSGRAITEFNHWLRHSPQNQEAGHFKRPCPNWMNEEELSIFVKAFSTNGFQGPLHRYRAQQLDVQDLQAWRGEAVQAPSLFVGGEMDQFRYSLPGYDLFHNPGQHCSDFRNGILIPDVGHWVQQEAPEILHGHLDAFFATVK